MDRRRLLSLLPAVTLASALPASAQAPAPFARNAPRGFETLPSIGMGTWLTFDVGDDAAEQEQRRQVLQRFFAAGGGMIYSSPMYGSAEWLLGELLRTVAHQGKLFAASKIWSPFESRGPGQLEQSLKLWRVPRFDVLLVHSMLNWRAHLKTLRRWKEQGRVGAGATIRCITLHLPVSRDAAGTAAATSTTCFRIPISRSRESPYRISNRQRPPAKLRNEAGLILLILCAIQSQRISSR